MSEKSFSLSAVGSHKSKTDLWLTIHGKGTSEKVTRGQEPPVIPGFAHPLLQFIMLPSIQKSILED